MLGPSGSLHPRSRPPRGRRQGHRGRSLERALQDRARPALQTDPPWEQQWGLRARPPRPADTRQELVGPGGACVGQGESPHPPGNGDTHSAYTRAQSGAPPGLTFPVCFAAARTATFPPSYPACVAAATSSCPSIRAAVNSREAAWRSAWEPQVRGQGSAGSGWGGGGRGRGCRSQGSSARARPPHGPPCVSARRLWVPPPPPAALAGSQGGQRRRREGARPAVPRGSV